MKQKKVLQILLICTLLVVFSTQALAALEMREHYFGSNDDAGNFPSGTTAGQTFQTSSGQTNIARWNITMYRDAGMVGTPIFFICHANFSSTPNGCLNQTVNVTLNSANFTTVAIGAWVNITFPQVSVDPATKYWALIHNPAGSGGQLYYRRDNTGPSYPNGSFVNTVGTELAGFDLLFANWENVTAAPGGNDTINISSQQPQDQESFNAPFAFNVTLNATGNNYNCSLYINDTINITLTNFSAPAINTVINFTNNSFNEGLYNYTIECGDGTTTENSSTLRFYYDISTPQLTTDFTNHSMHYLENITADFNFTDNIALFSVNISLNGTQIFYDNTINDTSFNYSFSRNPNNLTEGRHNLSVRFADGHTARTLNNPEDWSITNGLFNNYLEYTTDDNTKIKVYDKQESIFDSWSYEQKTDRFSEVYTPSNPLSTKTFIVEANKKIHVINSENHYGGTWLVIGNYWKDFVLENEPNTRLSIKKVGDKKAEITITGIKNVNELKFESTGELNIVQRDFTFYVINMTSHATNVLLINRSFSQQLSVDFGTLNFSISGITPNALLEFNGTNYTMPLTSFTSSRAVFNRSFAASFNLSEGTALHRYFFNFTNLTSGYINTSYYSQLVLPILVGACNTSQPFQIVNFSYFDEVTNNPMNSTTGYNLGIYDGIEYFNQTGNFARNYSHAFCTNLNDSLITYNWDMWGSMQLSEPTYVTRILEFDSSSPILISNNPTTLLDLYLVPINQSSTVLYRWFNSEFQLVDGTMRIYKCNINGTFDLTESIPIISGVGSANIILLTQPYSYNIIIDGEVFTDPVGFGRCHIESQTEITLFVNTIEANLEQVIGLNAIPCSLERYNATAVNMSWTQNPGDTTSYVAGCVEVRERTIFGSSIVYQNCSNQSNGNNIILDLPITGAEYVVSGYLQQANSIAICLDTLSFFETDSIAELMGGTGLLAVFLLTASAGLIYAGEGMIMIIGGIVGFVASWFLGILNFPWMAVSSITAFLALIAVIGRQAKRE